MGVQKSHFIIALFFTLTLGACDTTQSPTAIGIPWTKHDAMGLTIDLTESPSVEWIHLGKYGVASVSCGNERDGVYALAFDWKIVNGRLLLTDTERKVYEELTLLTRTSSSLTVKKRSGAVAKYKIVHPTMTPKQRAMFGT